MLFENKNAVIYRGGAATRTIHTMPYGSRIGMRLPNAAHESRPWRIREIAPDFIVEDVWALPVHGGVEDFQTLLEVMVSLDPANAGSRPLRVLWRLRDRLGSWFGLGGFRPRSTPVGMMAQANCRFRVRTKPQWPSDCQSKKDESSLL